MKRRRDAVPRHQTEVSGQLDASAIFAVWRNTLLLWGWTRPRANLGVGWKEIF